MIRILARWMLCVASVFACGPLGLCLVHSAQAPIRSLYQQGLDAYRAATPDLSSARASWTSALDRDLSASSAQRAQLCKSLGNLAFRQERPLEAAAWFSAAIELAPRDSAAWSNLEFARSKAGLEPADRGDLSATFERLVHFLSLHEAEWLALATALVLAALIVLRAFVLGRVAFRPLLGALLLTPCLCLPWLVHLREAAGDPVFVVSTAGVAVGSEPREAATKVALLSAGSRAERVEELAGWVRIETRQGERGWVPVDTVFALRR